MYVYLQVVFQQKYVVVGKWECLLDLEFYISDR